MARSRTRSAGPAYLPARFLSRPNRFLVVARLRGGRRVRAHLADPGRLRELLVPGARLRLRPAHASGRKTRFTVALVRAPGKRGCWVSVDTSLANRLAEALVRAGRVRGLPRRCTVHREVRRGRSRFDLLLAPEGGPEILVEVKSVTLVEDGLALFPDAPTARGRRHLAELEAHARAGGRAAVLFVAQRPDARAVAPNEATDPGFARALRSAARAGVRLRGAVFRLSARGEATWLGPIPVRLRPPIRVPARRCRV